MSDRRVVSIRVLIGFNAVDPKFNALGLVALREIQANYLPGEWLRFQREFSTYLSRLGPDYGLVIEELDRKPVRDTRPWPGEGLERLFNAPLPPGLAAQLNTHPFTALVAS
jgi:hypothetical protein